MDSGGLLISTAPSVDANVPIPGDASDHSPSMQTDASAPKEDPNTELLASLQEATEARDEAEQEQARAASARKEEDALPEVSVIDLGADEAAWRFSFSQMKAKLKQALRDNEESEKVHTEIEAELESQLKEAERQADELRTQLQEEQERSAALADALRNSKQVCEEIQQEAASLQKKFEAENRKLEQALQRAEKSQEDTTQAVERSNSEARKLQEKIAELEAKVKRQSENVRQLETENDKLQTKTRELQEWKKITQDEANKAVESLVMLQHDMTKLQQEKAELERRVKDGMDYEKVRDFYRKKSMLTLEQEDSEKKRAVDEVVHGDFDDDAQPDGSAVVAADLDVIARKGSDTTEMKVGSGTVNSDEPSSPLVTAVPNFAVKVHPSALEAAKAASGPLQEAPAPAAAAAVEAVPAPAAAAATPAEPAPVVESQPAPVQAQPEKTATIVELSAPQTADASVAGVAYVTTSTVETVPQREGEPSVTERPTALSNAAESTQPKDGSVSREQPFCVMCGRSCGGPDSSCSIM